VLLAAVTGSLLAVGGSATAAVGADARAARYARAVVAQVNRSRSALLARRVKTVGSGASSVRGRGRHVSLLLVGRRLGGGAGGSVSVEEAAPTPTPTDLTEVTALDDSIRADEAGLSAATLTHLGAGIAHDAA